MTFESTKCSKLHCSNVPALCNVGATKAKQANIFQAKQFLVPPLLTSTPFLFSRELEVNYIRVNYCRYSELHAAAGNTL